MKTLIRSLRRFADRHDWSTTVRRSSVVMTLTPQQQQQQQPASHLRITGQRPATASFHNETAQRTQSVTAAVSRS